MAEKTTNEYSAILAIQGGELGEGERNTCFEGVSLWPREVLVVLVLKHLCTRTHPTSLICGKDGF